MLLYECLCFFHFPCLFPQINDREHVLVMRQNDFSHDQDRDCIRVFKFCYFSVNEYLQRIYLLQGLG